MARGGWFVLALVLTQSAAAQVIKSNPAGVAKPLGAYSHVAEVPSGSKLLFLAGQVGNRPDGTLPASLEDQAVQALENIRLILADRGARPEHIVKMTIYVVGKPSDWSKLRAKRREMFAGTEPPPSTLVYVSALSSPEHLIEVDTVAVMPDAGDRGSNKSNAQ